MIQYVSSPSALGKRSGGRLVVSELDVGGTYVTGLVKNEWAVIDTKGSDVVEGDDFDQFLETLSSVCSY